MTSPNMIYSAFLFIAGAMCFLVGGIVVQKRFSAPGSVPLAVLLFSLSFWDLTYAVFWGGAPGPTPYFWLDITYFGAVFVPPAFLAFAMQVTGLEEWVKKPFLLTLLLEPVLVLLLMWTDPWHGLFFAGKRALNSGMILDAGPVFWLNAIYSELLMLIGFILFIRRYFKTKGVYRKQLGLILIGSAIPWINTILFLSGMHPLTNVDLTPFMFTIAAFAYAYAIVRYYLMDIIPIARDTLIEGMSDGVVVLDSHNRLIDINATVAEILNQNQLPIIGEPMEKVFTNWTSLVETFHDTQNARAEVLVEGRFLDIQISPLHDRRNNFIGRLVVWRDITDLKQTQHELHELATRDPLTQAYNRRHFMDLAEKEYQRAVSTSGFFSLVMMDIDHFKNVNDTHGHQVGDEVIKKFSRTCVDNIRPADTFARFGGEEFILLLPDTSQPQALEAATLLQCILKDAFQNSQLKVPVTASFGVTTMHDINTTLDEVIQQADHALYTAKETGRNKIVTWSAEHETQ